ncbi:MAG: methionyl-tRNA formyltransferase [Lachnospiraceae bacterium]|nr:methionyl-tRNA formyltransferase [Lachnospiraceae bacterium]
MKIIYMGTPDFAVRPLKAILEAGHEVLAVFTQPDKQKGRGREMAISPVGEYALLQNLPLLQPLKIRSEETIKELRKYNADIYVVAAYGQILSAQLLNLPRYGCINIHASLLPKYRGSAPIQRAIFAGEAKTGITIMQMDEGIDTGDILLAGEMPIEAKETSDTLHEKLSFLGADLIVTALKLIEAGKITPTRQDNEASTHAKMLSKEESKIDFSKSAAEIERLIRGLSSRPGAYTYYRNKTLKIWAADWVNTKSADKPGTIIEVTKDYLTASCGEGVLQITELQIEGKKKMPARDFLLGYKTTAGEIFG